MITDSCRKSESSKKKKKKNSLHCGVKLSSACLYCKIMSIAGASGKLYYRSDIVSLCWTLSYNTSPTTFLLHKPSVISIVIFMHLLEMCIKMLSSICIGSFGYFRSIKDLSTRYRRNKRLY